MRNGRDAAEIHRVRVQARTLRRLRAAPRRDRRDGAVGRNERVLDDDALRAGALHAHHVPVIDDAVLAALQHQLDHARCRLAVGVGHDRAAEVMRAHVAAGGRGPRRGDAIAARHRDGRARRVERRRAAEFASRAVELALTLQREVRKDHRVAGGERQHPAGLRTAARDFRHHAVEGRHVELVAAEAARLDDAVETRADQLGVDVIRHAAERLAVGLPRAQHGTQRGRAGDHAGGCEVGFGRGDRRRHCVGRWPDVHAASPRASAAALRIAAILAR